MPRSDPDIGGRTAGDGSTAAETIPADAVLAELDRLLASGGFQNSGRMSRFLRFVVEKQLAGHSSHIKETVLAVEIFDRAATYDSSVESVVRVEARRLREKLDRYYSGEGKDDPIVIALPKGSYAPLFSRASSAAPVFADPAPALRRTPRQVPLWILVAGMVTALGLAAAIHWLPSRGPAVGPLRRLTSDSGLTFQPALSQDGRLLAFASDRSGQGNLNIWLQQVSGGSAVRLTDNPADDVDPTFSPDGETIAYRAEGALDGIYLVPALGGTRTLVARGGYRPRFSPDGTRIAYWSGERSFRAAKIFIVPSSGGNPVPFVPDFPYAAFPIWSPDGRYIAFVGNKSGLLREESNTDDWDWWVASAAGGPATRLSARRTFDQQGLRPPESGRSHHRIVPESWTASGYLLCSARLEQTNIWRLRISTRNRQIEGPAEQLTFGAGREDHPSVTADGTLAFSVLTYKSDIWELPLHADTGQTRGSLVRLTSGEGNCLHPVVDNRGDRVVFLSDRSGNSDVWVKDLKTGAERALTATAESEVSPVLSPDGSQVAFGYPPPLRESISVVPFAGGAIRQTCPDCGEPRAWLPDGSGLLYQKISQGESLIGVLEWSGQTRVLVRSTESALFSPSVSRDGKWIALIVRTPPNDHRITVVPLRNGTAAANSDWIPVTESGPWVNKPRWSPNGNLLYYISDRDGSACIWASRLDPATKKPVGEPTPVMHFHSVRSSLDRAYGLELSIADDKLVVDVGENSGNIWLAPRR